MQVSILFIGLGVEIEVRFREIYWALIGLGD